MLALDHVGQRNVVLLAPSRDANLGALQQLTQSMARLYLLFFLLQRYQRINDNLINALIYQVRKVLLAAKVCLQERLLSDRMEGSKNVQHIGQILDLFLDESIAVFGLVHKRHQRAFIRGSGIGTGRPDR
jgi:hypothetical protein